VSGTVDFWKEINVPRFFSSEKKKGKGKIMTKKLLSDSLAVEMHNTRSRTWLSWWPRGFRA